MSPDKQLITFSLLVIAASFSPRLAFAAETPSLRLDKSSPVQIIQIEPSEGDLQRIALHRKRSGSETAEPNQVYVVKIYMHMPPPSAARCIFYVGQEKVQEYGPFPEGVFIKVYSAKQLESWRGKPIRALYRDEMIDLNVTVPPKADKAPSKMPTLVQAMKTENSP